MMLWILLIVWLAGWAYGARLYLTYRMNRTECTKGYDMDLCIRVYDGKCRKVAGEFRDRTLRDAVAAVGVGLAWPVLISAVALSATTPKTPGETRRIMADQERRIAEHAATIDRLHRQINHRVPRD